MSKKAQQKSNVFSFDYMPVTALISRDWEIIILFQCADMHNPALSSR